MTISFTERERQTFARHEADQRNIEASPTSAQRLEMLAQRNCRPPDSGTIGHRLGRPNDPRTEVGHD